MHGSPASAFGLYKIKNLFKSNFVRSISILAGGTAFAQGITVLAAPILTRIYTPSEFGVLGVFAALLGIIVVISSLRYELAIPLPKSDGAAANVLAVSLVCLLAVTVITLIAVALFGRNIAIFTNTPELTHYI